ncbi:magnesium transporter MRS2-I-like isoform X3 [Glycine soja]|uniref:magnesium transporter MRS2-I isoform X3 n=1 Tax=Glycine max TaxID=3847 RepID=UPI0003DE8AEC|nr:magnesium transporter MRS2-I isoform X3 [Glycine max]XP_028225555.1 magnesium transporter MRS2-I-like isoform X3 [Glycine soja]|eukprot:XP_006576923.1 magnesium transporter MRS2-I isoform X3 [Glycine max]
MALASSVVELQPSSVKKKTAVSRSWILLDHYGKGTVLDADKYAIMRLVQIHARDLRILDPLLSYPSTILGREKVIVLNLEHIKAIITADEVLLRDPMDDDVVPIVEELRRRLPQVSAAEQGQGKEEACAQDGEEFPFEIRALEALFEAICSFLDARTRELETSAYPALDELISKISSRNLDRVRKLKCAMTRLTIRVQKIRDELESLLDDDDDMADLYLSRKLDASSSPTSSSDAPYWLYGSPNTGSKRHKSSRVSGTTVQRENDVEELEMLLEAYFMQIDGTLNKLATLREYIDDTEDYINIQLDNHRNQLIQLELFISVGTVCMSLYSLVAAIFGMNIPYTWKAPGHEHVFKWVCTHHLQQYEKGISNILTNFCQIKECYVCVMCE